jgi:multiple sugar transport system substrate-binding protein
MKRLISILSLLLVLALALVACGGGGGATDNDEEPQATVAAEEDTTEEDTTEEDTTEEDTTEEDTTEEDTTEEDTDTGDKTQIRWFVGLGTGTNPEQVAAQEEVAEDFNASQDEIELVLEIVPYEAARDALSTQIASGNGPDIIGPVGWGGSNDFYGQWLDLTPFIESTGFDTSVFDPALVEFYQTEEGQVGLPFAVFPAAIYYVPAYFDEVGLAYPPSTYGEQYELDGEMVDWNWDTLTIVAKRLTLDVNGLNSTEEGFDPSQIVQVGFAFQWQTHPYFIGSYVAGAADIVEGDAPGEYSVAIPDSWKEANRWYYEAMWGDQPFTATGPLAAAPEFGNGNLFNTGKAAMGASPLWYTCCLNEFRDAGLEFQAGAMPTDADGNVHSRVDADTFRIWKGTDNPEAAFTVLSYLLTTGADKLLPVYGAMPAVAEKTEAFFDSKTEQYPFVTPETWAVFQAGLAYPDAPSAEQWQPSSTEAWARAQSFFDLMQNTSPDEFDFDAEWQTFIDDLTVIYNQE